MKKFIFLYLMILLFLTSCAKKLPDVQHPKDQFNAQHVITQRTFYTSDGKTKFVIHNQNAKVPKPQLDWITQRTNQSYDMITHYFKHPTYQWPKTIDIHLKLGYGTSFSAGYGWTPKNSITLYSADTKEMAITHELTHELLGYNSNGFFTQEGLATYFQNKYGTPEYKTISLDQMVKYLAAHKKLIPISPLTLSKKESSYFRSKNPLTEIKSYNEAGSFVGFLIQKYGRNKFYAIYNKPNLRQRLAKVYGKNVKMLQKEWISYLSNKVKPLSQKQVQKLLTIYPNLN